VEIVQQPAKLVICPTPLGNLGDMTPRALDALRQADTVCAEDTRVTGRLLAAFGIHARLERLDEAGISSRASAVIERARNGEAIAYCSDAGMPGVSDPGQRLVAAARAAGVSVEVLPGPTAVATAYVASGFLCPRFYFGGFFPRKEGDRESALHGLESLDAVALFYESPRRVCAALHAIARILPMRQIAVCRELTKLHEEILVDSAEELAAVFDAREAAGGVKGEIVLVIDAPGKEESVERVADAREAARIRAAELLAEGSLSKKDAAKVLQEEFGLQRNDAYSLVHGS
jgi:16S rRNA (cytidine1402-2'-O)-methyltransferase